MMPSNVRIVLALAALCVTAVCDRAYAQVRTPQTVLTIHQGAETFPANPIIDAGIEEALKSRPDVPIDYFTEYLESDRFPEEAASRAFEEYLRGKYRGHKIDVVIATTDSGLGFVLDHRAELFPDAAIVYSGLGVISDTARNVGAGIAGIRIGVAYAETLQQALAQNPSAERVFVVANSVTPQTQELIRERFREYSSKAALAFIDEPTLPGLLAAVKEVPSRSVILYQGHQQDDPGHSMYADEIAPLVVAAARVPVYGTSDFFIGSGVVGGVVRDTRETGTRLGAIALRILTGTRAQDIPIEGTRVVPIFDWRAMQKWGISENQLPPGSIVQFRGPSLWRDYRRQVLGVAGALVLQSLLIAGLLYQRRARRRAEHASRRNLALAADADRRSTMSALTGSIAHELSQPLNAILHNAQAGEMLVKSNRATLEMLREILSDIRDADVRATQIIERHRTMLRNHQMEKKPLDIHAVVRESLAFVEHDTKAKQVQVDVELPSESCVVAGDRVLLQQVLVNLMMNAMEAMADTPVERRRVTVRSELGKANVAVSVRDYGSGLPANIDGKVFEPFVTTKSNGIGIGLTIARTIVEAHRGQLQAHNNPDGGATFVLTLQCADRP